MHYYLSKICFLCLGSKIQLTNVFSSAETFEEIHYTFPEITNELTETPLFICSVCQDALRFFHSYKTTCLNNYERWLTYTRDMKKDSAQEVKFSECKIVLNKLQLYVTVDSDTEDEDDIPQEQNWQLDYIKTEKEDDPSSSSEKLGLLELKKLYCQKCKKIFKLYVSKQTNDSLSKPPDVNCMFCNNILIETPSTIMQLLKQKTIETNENKTKEISMNEIMTNNEKYRLLKVAKQKITDTANPFISDERVQETIEPIEKTNELLTCKPIEDLVEKTNEPSITTKSNKKTNAFLTCKPIQELLEKTKTPETNDKYRTLKSLLKTTEPMKKTNELLTWQPNENTIQIQNAGETSEIPLKTFESVQKTIEPGEIIEADDKRKYNLRLLRIVKKRKRETNEMVQKTSEPMQKTNEYLTCKPIEKLVDKTKKLKPNKDTYVNQYLTFVNKQIKTYEPIKKTKQLETNENQFVTFGSAQKTIAPIEKTNEFLFCKPINMERNQVEFIAFAAAQETIEPMKKNNKFLTCKPIEELVGKTKKLETNENPPITFESAQKTIEPMEINEFLTYKPTEELVEKTKQFETNEIIEISEDPLITFESAEKTIEPIGKTKQLETNENPPITFESAQKTIEPMEINEFLTCRPTEVLVDKTKQLETNEIIEISEDPLITFESAEKTIEPIGKTKQLEINEFLNCKPTEELFEKTKQLETNEIIEISEDPLITFESAQKTIELIGKTKQLETNENPPITIESAQKTIEPMEINEFLTYKPTEELVEKTKQLETNEISEDPLITFESAEKTIEPIGKTKQLETNEIIEISEDPLITCESTQKTIEPMAKTSELLICKPMEKIVEKINNLETNEKLLITFESAQITIEPMQQTNELLTCQPIQELVEKTNELETNELVTCQPVPETVEKTNENINQIQNSDEICNNETEINNLAEKMRSRLREKLNSQEKAEQEKAEQQLGQLQTTVPRRQFHDKSKVIMSYMSLNDDRLSGKCKICYKTFPTKPLDIFDRHLKGHIGNGKYQCVKCNKRFMFKINLEKHMQFYHSTDVFPCNLCDRVFATNIAKVQHMLGHKDETAQNIVI